MSAAADIHALAGAYALDALDDMERAAFSRHLRECDACSTEVAELRETAARLADTTWAAPPPGLRASVLSQVANTRQLAPGGSEPAPVVAAVSRWRRVTAAAAAAGVVAAGAGALSTAIQERRVRDEHAVAQAAQAELDRMQAVLEAPDVATRTGRLAGGGRATVVMSPSRDKGVVLVSDLPAPPGGKAYQLWMMRPDTSAVSAGVLPPQAKRAKNLIESMKGMTAFGITLEDAAGAKAPSMAPLVTISLV